MLGKEASSEWFALFVAASEWLGAAMVDSNVLTVRRRGRSTVWWQHTQRTVALNWTGGQLASDGPLRYTAFRMYVSPSGSTLFIHQQQYDTGQCD